jgi:hypothetical protein
MNTTPISSAEKGMPIVAHPHPAGEWRQACEDELPAPCHRPRHCAHPRHLLRVRPREKDLLAAALPPFLLRPGGRELHPHQDVARLHDRVAALSNTVARGVYVS